MPIPQYGEATGAKCKAQSGKYACFPDERLWEDYGFYGLVRLKVRKRSFA